MMRPGNKFACPRASFRALDPDKKNRILLSLSMMDWMEFRRLGILWTSSINIVRGLLASMRVKISPGLLAKLRNSRSSARLITSSGLSLLNKVDFPV
jgi:hypothetical protein